ncbi:VOC family protein [Streptomyces physcomitrii]|uniref:VOC family protein n=1 Tax=Streptomyces physcomitrii TaxID=2724184 RepID=UPI0033D165B7
MLTTRPVDGAPNWIDLGTPDIEAAGRFYGEILGWELERLGPETGGYGMFSVGGKYAAGAIPVPADQGPPSWSVYFRSTDVDATVRRVEEHGGSVTYAPMDVTDQGRYAHLVDPAGAGFGVWQAGVHQGLGFAGAGGLCWTELYTPDIEAATGFYARVFGWTSEEVAFPGGKYTVVSPGPEKGDGGFGGVADLESDPSERYTDPHWTLYFAVADADAVCARTTELGGTVRSGPEDMAGVGRLAQLADPQGARFAILKPAPQEG